MFEINLLSKAPSEVAGVTGNAGAIGSVTVGTVGTVGGGAGEGMKGGVAVHQVAMETGKKVGRRYNSERFQVTTPFGWLADIVVGGYSATGFGEACNTSRCVTCGSRSKRNSSSSG